MEAIGDTAEMSNIHVIGIPDEQDKERETEKKNLKK